VIFLNELDKQKINELFSTNSSYEFEYISSCEDDTKKLGKEFAKYIAQGTIITLNGELGSGKTVFLMGIASHFNIQNDVCSPTLQFI